MRDDVLALFHRHQRFLLTTHRRPDGDAVGSQLALGRFLQKLGKDVAMINTDAMAHNLSWLPGADAIQVFDGSLAQHEQIGGADVVVVLDTNSAERLDRLGKPIQAAAGVKLLLDHHTHPEGWFDLAYRRESASSTGELVYELIAAEDPGLIDHHIAAPLYVAIMTDTGSFRFSNVTPAIHHAIADLIERGGLAPSELHAAVYDVFSLQGLRLLGRALDSIRLSYNGRMGYIVITEAMLQETGAERDDTEGFVNHILSIEGTEVALIFIESGSGIKISFRSKGDRHVHRWAIAFGGGGHRNASGAYVRGTLDEVIEAVLAEAPRYAGFEAPDDPHAASSEDTELSSEDAAYLALLSQKANNTP